MIVLNSVGELSPTRAHIYTQGDCSSMRHSLTVRGTPPQHSAC